MNRSKKILALFITFIFLNLVILSAETFHKEKTKTYDISIIVLDKKTNQPLQLASIILERNNSIIASTVTAGPSGKALFRDIEQGWYIISIHYIGYQDIVDSILINSKHRIFKYKMTEKWIKLKKVVVNGKRTNKISTFINIRTGQQVFENEMYHPAPSSQMIQLIQQNLVGAVRAPTGEVHIRGQHGEFTYFIDGLPIPLGVFGGLNEIIDPEVISRVKFYTGGFPSEFGGQISGIIDIQTMVPSGSFHLNFSSFLGSYFTSNNENLGSKVGNFKSLNLNGQSIFFHNHIGKFGYFVAAKRQETDRRIDQPVKRLFHDRGFDYFVYGKLDYLLGNNDFITTNLNFSKTQTQIPYNPLEGFNADDQITYNAFQTVSYFHTFSSELEKETKLFIGAFVRVGGLRFLPNVNDDNRVFINNDTTKSFVIDQKRRYSTFGIRIKYSQSLNHHFKFFTGGIYSYTSGITDFRFFNSNSNNLVNNSNFDGYNFGIFSQIGWHPFEWTNIAFGLRYDLHNSPEISNQNQLSPRFKWSFFLNNNNTLTISYDRIFMPTAIENIGAVAKQLGNNAKPTLPEKDNLYAITYLRNWGSGFITKIDAFHKDSFPGLDDETLGSSSIRVNVNIAKINVSGIEFALIYNPLTSPFSGYINASIIHAYGRGPVSGGFLPGNNSTVPFDLDHDQRLSAVLELNYQPKNWFLNFLANYGSGLSNDNPNYKFKTGLFNFNQSAHTTPYWIFNISSGYIFYLGKGQTLEPSIYITNLFDHAHLIKGAFFSGASFEERRKVEFKLSYNI